MKNILFFWVNGFGLKAQMSDLLRHLFRHTISSPPMMGEGWDGGGYVGSPAAWILPHCGCRKLFLRSIGVGWNVLVRRKYSTVRGFGGIWILKMNISWQNLHFPKGYDVRSKSKPWFSCLSENRFLKPLSSLYAREEQLPPLKRGDKDECNRHPFKKLVKWKL